MRRHRKKRETYNHAATFLDAVRKKDIEARSRNPTSTDFAQKDHRTLESLILFSGRRRREETAIGLSNSFLRARESRRVPGVFQTGTKSGDNHTRAAM